MRLCGTNILLLKVLSFLHCLVNHMDFALNAYRISQVICMLFRRWLEGRVFDYVHVLNAIILSSPSGGIILWDGLKASIL